MAAVRVKKTVEKDGEILLTGLPVKKGQHVDIIVEAEPIEQPARDLAEALARHALDPARFRALQPGAVVTI